MQIADDEPAGQRAEQRTDERRNRDEAERPHQLGPRSNVRTRVRRPTGTIMAPPQPCRMRAATSMWMLPTSPHRNEPRREDPDGRGEDTACPVAVRHPATHGNEDREAQCVARQSRLHAERRNVQGGRDRRHRRVQDGRVERLHEERNGHQPGQHPLHVRSAHLAPRRCAWGTTSSQAINRMVPAFRRARNVEPRPHADADLSGCLPVPARLDGL